MDMNEWTDLTPADFLVRGLNLPRPEKQELVDVPPGTTCAITGQPIRRGYRVSDMTTGATAEFLDCFRGGPHGYVSENAGRCFKSYRETSQQLMIFEDGTCYNPLISIDTARKRERTCWSELVREVWPARKGQRVLILLTTDMKKRLWPNARVGALSDRTPVLLYDNATHLDTVAIIDWEQMIQCLDLVESVYDVGFSKGAIREGLLSSYKTVEEVGIKASMALETALRLWRGKDEFSMATLIAQKGE